MANKVYNAPETALTFKDSGGDAVLSLNNLAFGAGRISAQYDRGTGSKPSLYEWRAVMQFNTAPAVGETIEIYLATGDSTTNTLIDGTLGASDAALTTDKRRNLKLIGVVVVDTTSTSTNIIASGICEIYSRYISVGVWNGSAGDNLKASANVSYVILTPVPPEIQ